MAQYYDIWRMRQRAEGNRHSTVMERDIALVVEPIENKQDPPLRAL